MALVKCHECGGDVSSEAAACPKCGAKPKLPKPSPRKFSLIEKIGIGIGAIIFVVWIFAPSKNDQQDTSATANVANDAACRKDLQCWGDKNLSAAHVYCKDSIEREAKYSVKWTDEGMFATKFSRFNWLNQNAGTLRYFGDKAQFQNVFGAYQNMIYECDIDPATNAILGVNVTPGHL